MWTDSPGVVNGGEVQEVTSFGSGVLSLSPPSLPNEFGSAFPGLSARGEELSDAVDGWSMLDSFSLPMDDGVFCNEASMGARTIAAAGQSVGAGDPRAFHVWCTTFDWRLWGVWWIGRFAAGGGVSAL